MSDTEPKSYKPIPLPNERLVELSETILEELKYLTNVSPDMFTPPMYMSFSYLDQDDEDHYTYEAHLIIKLTDKIPEKQKITMMTEDLVRLVTNIVINYFNDNYNLKPFTEEGYISYWEIKEPFLNVNWFNCEAKLSIRGDKLMGMPGPDKASKILIVFKAHFTKGDNE
jgi:hypothetical protein